MSQKPYQFLKKHVKHFVIDDFDFLVCESPKEYFYQQQKKQKSVIKFTSLKSNRLCTKKVNNNYGHHGEYNIGIIGLC